MHQRHVHHGTFVDDEQIAVERLLLVAQKPATRREFEQPMDRFRPQAGGFAETLRRAAGRRAEQAAYRLARRMPSRASSKVVLPTPGPPVMTNTREESARPKRVALARGKRPPRFRLVPRDGAFQVDLGVGDGWRQGVDAPRDAFLRTDQAGQINERLAAGVVAFQFLVGERLRQGLVTTLSSTSSIRAVCCTSISSGSPQWPSPVASNNV